MFRSRSPFFFPGAALLAAVAATILVFASSVVSAAPEILSAFSPAADTALATARNCSRNCATAASNGALDRSSATTSKPSRARRAAVARPMPCAAPVTKAVFPVLNVIMGAYL